MHDSSIVHPAKCPFECVCVCVCGHSVFLRYRQRRLLYAERLAAAHWRVRAVLVVAMTSRTRNVHAAELLTKAVVLCAHPCVNRSRKSSRSPPFSAISHRCPRMHTSWHLALHSPLSPLLHLSHLSSACRPLRHQCVSAHPPKLPRQTRTGHRNALHSHVRQQRSQGHRPQWLDHRQAAQIHGANATGGANSNTRRSGISLWK